MLKKNDILLLEITDMTNLGFGVARHGNLVIFIAGAVKGDVVKAKIIKLTSSYAVARTEELIKPSEKRSDDRCTIKSCQSCAYKCIEYEEELKMKHADVISAFKKAELDEIKIVDPIPSPTTKNYRNKAQYPIDVSKNGDYIVGFYAPKSHRVTEARACPLAPKEFPEIIETLAEYFKENKLSVYDEDKNVGLLRHIYLRRGEISREIMLTLVINGDDIPNSDAICQKLITRHPKIKTILLNINKEKTNVILGDKYKTLTGNGTIKDTLAGIELKLTPPSFYQVNHSAAELLYKKAGELAAPENSDTILDLFCGVGSIGLSMANKAGELIGIEIVESAVEMARENAKNAGFENAKFYTGDAKYTEKLLDNAEKELGRKIKPSIIILDPPRSGCDRELIHFSSSLSAKKIVYISCNPQTLARDLKIFKEMNYLTTKVYLYDLFPGTGHIESVCLLQRSECIQNTN